MIIDMHAHFTPRGLLAAAADDRPWYGWRFLMDASGKQYISLGERVLPFTGGESTLEDPGERNQARRAEQGITMEALVLGARYWNQHLDPDTASTYCREVNQELAEVQNAYPDSYRGMAILPHQDERLALKELEHATAHLGLGVVVVPTHFRGRNLDDPSMVVVLEEAARLGVPVAVHPTRWDTIGHERLPRHFFWNSFGAPLESSLALMSLTYSGLLDRFPDFRVMFTQGGGWVHYGIGRFTLRYDQREDARVTEDRPDEYLRRAYYDCLIHDDASLRFLLDRVGSTQVFVGTDYTAGGDIPGGAANWIKSLNAIDETERESILWRNAARFLGLGVLSDEPDRL